MTAHETTTAALLAGAIALAGACTGHAPGQRLASSDCEQCHLVEFDEAVDPVHTGVFPERCVACHATDAWIPEDNAGHEDIFPIFSGPHRQLACDDCHPPPDGSFTFTCIDCHEHSQSRMDARHRGKSNYRWESPRCLSCHPKGRE